jgi:3-deoxy-7-phosphoheptulonate synthase
MIDASHGNSQKKHENQLAVIRDIAEQLADGESRIFGVMIESHLMGGRQDLMPGRVLSYGQSITDGCIGWDDTVAALDVLAEAVSERRVALAQ